MSVDRTKVLETAQKYLAKANYDRAILEFRKIVDADPKDVRTWLKIGDLYTRKGARSEAIETYAKVARQYGDQGFFLKAVAVYKQILKLDSTRLGIQLKLGEMYEMLALVSDALATYEQAVTSFSALGDTDSVLTTLRKMTDLDPENIPIRIKFAETLSRAEHTKEAAEQFAVGAELLEAQGRIDDFVKVAERLLFHRPTDAQMARRLAGLYLERRDPKRALSKLQLCFKADPKHIPTLELLAEAFRQLGQVNKTVSVYREVAGIHRDARRTADQARVLKQILELDPADAEARQALANFADRPGADRPSATRPSAPVPDPQSEEPELIEVDEEFEDPDLLEESMSIEHALDNDDLLDDAELLEDDLEVLDGDEDVVFIEEESSPQAYSPQSVDPAPSVSTADVQREAQIARLLTECDVFLRYGLQQKVVDQLHAVLEIDPMHIEARQRLKEVRLAQGNVESALSELITLADLNEDNDAEAIAYLQEALELDPDHEDARERLNRLGVETPQDSEELAPPILAPDLGDDAVDDVFFVEEEGETTQDGTELEVDLAISPPSGAADSDESLSLDTDRPPGPPPGAMLDDFSVPSPGVPRVPSPGMLSPDLSEHADPLAPMSPAEFEELAPGLTTPSERPSRPVGEVEELLDEADFFIDQGLLEEARVNLTDALIAHPGHPLLNEKLREVEMLAQQEQHQRESTQQLPAVDQSFALAEKLADDFEDFDEPTHAGSDVLDVEQVFAQFKKGVESQVSSEDAETHYDLGIAYKEMGLFDDAISEFRLCLSDEKKICIAETMIGFCFSEKGQYADAISHFKKGLYAEHKTPNEEMGLYFELGSAYERLRDPKEAVYYYQKVQRRDATFRDVGNRILAISQPQSASVPAPMQADDIDAAFDDLLGED